MMYLRKYLTQPGARAFLKIKRILVSMFNNLFSSGEPNLGLALGSGGARGLSHIGVIKALSAEGYQVTHIADSSIGALVGGFGFGPSHQMEARKESTSGYRSSNIRYKVSGFSTAPMSMSFLPSP